MASDEDVPPLEDMSDLIKQVDALREVRQQNKVPIHGKGVNCSSEPDQRTVSNGNIYVNKTDKPLTEVAHSNGTSEKKLQNVQSSKDSAFGGMKKGFLFGGPSKPKAASNKGNNGAGNTQKDSLKSSSSEGKEEIPFIKKSQQSSDEHLRLTEVQEAMTKTNEKLKQNKEWVTDDLLNKLQKNEKLVKQLQDPTFVQAIGDFQKNPQEAQVKYGNNTEVQEFFKDFCCLMGDHFNNLADQMPAGDNQSMGAGNPSVRTGSQSSITTVTPGGADISVRSSTNPHQATAEEEARMKQILSDPEIRFILMDQKIQDLFETLRTDPSKGERILKSANGDLRGKIEKLVKVGLLQFQR